MPEIEDGRFRLLIKTEDDAVVFNTSWYSVVSNMTRQEAEEESMLGMSAATNAWHLVQASPTNCHPRNFCELGFNGSVWGEVGALMVEMMGQVIIRFVSMDMEQETELYNALRLIKIIIVHVDRVLRQVQQ